MMTVAKKCILFVILFGLTGICLTGAQTADQLVGNAIGQLQIGVQLKMNGSVKIGTITYGDTELPTQFSAWFKELLSASLAKTHLFVEVAGNDVLKENPTLVGIENPDYILQATYWEDGDHLRSTLSLLETMTTKKLNAVAFDLPKGLIPASVAYLPTKNSKDVMSLKKTLNTGKHDFKLSLWTNKGDSPVYRNGEKLVLFIKSEKDCFIKMFHLSAENQIMILFPNVFQANNFIKAGQVVQIPDPSWNFEFVLQPPFGTEFVHLVASTVQFDDIKQYIVGDGFYSIGTNNTQTQNDLTSKGIGVQSKNALVSEVDLSYIVGE